MSEFDDGKPEQEMIEEIQESGISLTAWECDFLDSIEEQLTRHGLSERYIEVLVKIHRRV